MDFQIKPVLNKELILSKYSEEQIMEFYLHIKVKKGLFRSPLRVDKNPTCSFFRNSSGTLYFKDFATGQCLNCFSVVQELFRCNYHEALKIIANDLGIIRDSTLIRNKGKISSNVVKIEDKEISKIQVQVQDFTELELKWWNKYGITKDILDKYRVYSCKYVFLNGNILAESKQHCPIFGYYGGMIQQNKEKIELWRCYFPKRTSYRWITNWPSKKIQGYEQLPKKGNILCITKSMKDLMCLHSLGINAIAPNSENLFLSDNVLKNLKERFKYIVVFYDNDRPGLYNMAKIRRQYPELLYTYIPKKYNSKDISDFHKNYGRKKSLKLIEELVLWIKSKQYGGKN